jgi:hypothetical protein
LSLCWTGRVAGKGGRSASFEKGVGRREILGAEETASHHLPTFRRGRLKPRVGPTEDRVVGVRGATGDKPVPPRPPTSTRGRNTRRGLNAARNLLTPRPKRGLRNAFRGAMNELRSGRQRRQKIARARRDRQPPVVRLETAIRIQADPQQLADRTISTSPNNVAGGETCG